jgi:hypothetical protein
VRKEKNSCPTYGSINCIFKKKKKKRKKKKSLQETKAVFARVEL